MNKLSIRKNTFAMKILKGVGMAGAVMLCSTNPYFGLGLVKGLINGNDKKSWRRFYQSLNYLNRRGYVKLEQQGDKIKAEVTIKGQKIIELLDIDELKLPRERQWDGKWRVVIFDVPNQKSSNRLAFSQKIKELGFVYVQKSVWAYPFECKKEIMILRKFYDIEEFVTYMEALNIEDELEWRKRFNLSPVE